MSDFAIHHVDCLAFLKSLPDGRVQSVITDPPYGIGLTNNDRDGHRRRASFRIDNDHSQDAGLAVLGWCECANLPTVFFASPSLPWPGEWRNLIVWDKGGAVGGGGDIRTCLKRTWELIQVARNGGMNGPRDGSVWRHPMCPQDTAEHICAKPVELMERLIIRFTHPGDTIFDPFMGSGTTGVACMNTGRNFIGCEISAEYFQIADRRIREAKEQAESKLFATA